MQANVSSIALAVVAAIGAASISHPAKAADSEKCYGVAKAGKNDCQTNVSSCAGTNKMDGNKQAFILLPKGSCEKIDGGSLTPGK